MAAYSPGFRGTSTWSPQPGSGQTDNLSSLRVDSYSEDPEDEEQEARMEPPLEDTSHMNFVDGRCTCCPYGYHIDLDFLRYLESLNNGSYLKNLKKIHRDKKKLRKSMEVFLHHQETNSTPPPDLVHNTESFIDLVDQQNTATNQILEEIDSSVNATLSSIDVMYSQKSSAHGTSGNVRSFGGKSFSGDEMDFGHSQSDQRYRAEAELPLQNNRADSVSSLESHSTYSSDINSLSRQREVTTTTTVTTVSGGSGIKVTGMTASQLANNMANLLPDTQHQEPDVSPSTLQAIREQMAFSLQRMKELEEQVKAIPVLQVRINVLKEEKRLLGLQLKAKHSKMNTRSIGVGDCKLDDHVEPLTLSSRFQTVTNINLSQLGLKSVANGDLRPPRPAMRSIGVGDGNVFDSQMQVAAYAGVGGTKYHEKEFHTEQNTEVREKEVKTVFLGQGSDSDAQLRLYPPWKSADRPRKPEKPERPPRRTRSIGTGEDDVFDSSSNVHVHEKELRTVYIADEKDKKKETRNVGILCKAAMRDVGVTYMYEMEKPNMKNIAVGVGEIGVGEGYFSEGDGTMSSNTSHTTHMALQQMNLAAFHSRHIHINNEQLLTILDTMLKKDLRSVSTQCQFPSVDKAVQHVVDLTERTSIGCGSDSVDVVVKQKVQMKSVGCENRPLCMNRLVGTEKGFTRDTASNTFSQMITKTRATNTEQVLMYPAAVNTDRMMQHNATTATEVAMFESMEALRTRGTNTQVSDQVTTATNTEHSKRLTHHNFDFDITFTNKGVNTDDTPARKNVYDRGVNTEAARMFSRGMNTQSPKLVERGINVVKEYMPSTGVQTEINTITRGVGDCLNRMPSHSIGTGDMPLDQCENCYDRAARMRPAAVNTEPVRTKSIGVGYQSIREDYHMTEVTSDVYTSKLSPKKPEVHVEYTATDGTTRGGGSSITQETTRTVKSSSMAGRPTEIGQGGRNIVTERTITTSGGGINMETMMERPSSFSTQSLEDGRSTEMGRGGRSIVTERTVTTSRGTSGGTGSMERMENPLTVSSPGGQSVGGSSMRTERTVVSRGGGGSVERVIENPLSVSGDLEDLETRLGGSASSNVTRETRTVTSSSRPATQGRRIVVEKRMGSGGSGGMVEEEVKDGHGGTQMRVVRHIETSYVGGQPVNKTSNVVVSGGEQERTSEHVEELSSSSAADQMAYMMSGGSGERTMFRGGSGERTMFSGGSGERTMFSGGSGERTMFSGGSGERTMMIGGSEAMTRTQDVERDIALDATLGNNNQGENIEYTKTVQQPKGVGRKVVITETRIERRRTGDPGESMVTTTTTESTDSNGLRSIMKQPGLDQTDVKQKKEISFSEDVVGGSRMRRPDHLSLARRGVHSYRYVSTSSDGDDDQDEEVTEGDVEMSEGRVEDGGSDSDGSQSSISYDEGSYDGRAGKIVYSCKDDEAIAQGAPGAKMYKENVQESFELTSEMTSACEIYAQWLEDSTQITTKQLNSALAVVQHEWFKVSSTKTSSPGTVEEYLSCLTEFSDELLQQIVNLSDVNGNTALHYAVSHCNMEIVNLLLDTHSMDVNKQNKAGYTAIMLASLAHVTTDRQRDIIARMFGMGDVNARASQAGQTALMLAVSHGRQDMVQMLLETGASVNMQDEDGSTALMCASEHGHTDIVKMLLGQPDCDPTIQDNDGSSALSIAMEAGHRDIGVLLYAHVNFKQGSPESETEHYSYNM